MGIGFLKRLIQEAKDTKDVITLEATVVTGFELQALDECREKCRPLNVTRSKGRIFFNIKKESYPDVLKMRSIDNVFLVSETFEELKLNKVKDEDLLIIKNLVEQVNWGKSVPEWAEIVGYKGVQFPKCAQRDPNGPLDESEPACQNCLKAVGLGGGDTAQSEDGGRSRAENGQSLIQDSDAPDANLMPGEEVDQTLPEKCHLPECKKDELATRGSSYRDGIGSVSNVEPIKKEYDSPKVNLISDEEVFQTPPDKCAVSECKISDTTGKSSPNGDGKALDKSGSALESSPEVHLLKAEETDDEMAFHSAEEDLPIEQPVGDKITCPEQGILDAKNDSNAPKSASVGSDEIKSAEEVVDAKHAKYEKQPAKQSRRREERDAKHMTLAASDGATKPVGGPKDESGSVSHGSDKTESNDGSSQNGSDPAKPVDQNTSKDKKKSQWQKRREAKAKKAESGGRFKPAEVLQDDPERASHGSDKTESNEASSQNGSELAEPVEKIHPKDEKKKNYWQKRKEAKAKKADEARAKKPPRKAYIDDGIMKFRVTCYRNGPKHSFDSNDAAGHFGGLINDKFHWTVDLTRHDINVVLVIEGDSAYVTLALTTKSLHKRNIKHFGPTTLRATLCYGLLCLAEPRCGDIVMDPMCGGGSIPIEGALAFRDTYHVCGDANTKCVTTTGDNIAHNSKERPLLVDAFQWNVRRLPLQDSSIDVFVTDLPFGLRVGKQRDNTGLYTAALSEAARVVRTCGRAALLTYDRTAMIRALQRTRHLWREVRVTMVNQGGLRCFAYLLLRKALVVPSLMDSAVPAQDSPSAIVKPAVEGSDNPDDVPPDCATSELPELNPEDSVIPEPTGLPAKSIEFPEMSELVQELSLQEPSDLPALSPSNQPDSDQKCSDDTKCA